MFALAVAELIGDLRSRLIVHASARLRASGPTGWEEFALDRPGVGNSAAQLESRHLPHFAAPDSPAERKVRKSPVIRGASLNPLVRSSGFFLCGFPLGNLL